MLILLSPGDLAISSSLGFWHPGQVIGPGTSTGAPAMTDSAGPVEIAAGERAARGMLDGPLGQLVRRASWAG